MDTLAVRMDRVLVCPRTGRESMVVSIEEDIQLLTDAGDLTEEEFKREAFRALLRERPELGVSLAVERYKQGEITLNRGAELAGVTTEEFKRTLAEPGGAGSTRLAVGGREGRDSTGPRTSAPSSFG